MKKKLLTFVLRGWYMFITRYVILKQRGVHVQKTTKRSIEYQDLRIIAGTPGAILQNKRNHADGFYHQKDRADIEQSQAYKTQGGG